MVYPDGPRDAEALLAHPVTGRLYVVSKVVFGGTIYEAPERLGTGSPNRLRALADVTGLVTDGAFFPDGRHLVLRTYTKALVYSFPDLSLLGEIDLPGQRQGEGIAVLDDEALFLSSEGVNAPLLRVDLPDEIRDAMAASGRARAVGVRVGIGVRTGVHIGIREHVADGEQRPAGRGSSAGSRARRDVVAHRHRRDGPHRDHPPSGVAAALTAPAAWPPCHACVVRPRTTRAGPDAAQARDSSTSTSTASGSDPTTCSAARTWSSRPRGGRVDLPAPARAPPGRGHGRRRAGGSTSTTRPGDRRATTPSSSASSTSARRCSKARERVAVDLGTEGHDPRARLRRGRPAARPRATSGSATTSTPTRTTASA